MVIENRDYTKVLLQQDTEKTLHYIDPPYVHATRNMQRGNAAYEFEMSDEDHKQLADVVKSLKGMVIISGYQSDLYDELFPDWITIKREAYADGANKRIECLWLNPHAASLQAQLSIFDNS